MLSPACSPAHASTRLSSTVSMSSQQVRNLLIHERSADEGGVTKMSGGIQAITLPAGYLGSSFIGACLIACGFDTKASKIACLVLAAFFLFTLWWARKNWLYVRPVQQLPSKALKFPQVLGLNRWHVWPHYSLLVCRGCGRSEIFSKHFENSSPCVNDKLPGVVYWRNVLHVRPLGRRRCVLSFSFMSV